MVWQRDQRAYVQFLTVAMWPVIGLYAGAQHMCGGDENRDRCSATPAQTGVVAHSKTEHAPAMP